MKIFSERLKTLRGAVSQTAFAKRLGVSQVALSRFETNKREPDLETLCRFSITLAISADWLLGLTDNPSIDRGGVTNTATANGAGAQAAAGGTIQNGDPATAAILERLAALEAKVAASSTPPRKKR